MFAQFIVYCVQCTPFPPVAEICARLANNFCQYMTTVSCWANSLVWVSVCYFTASQQGGGGRGSEATLSPQRYTALHYLPQVARAGRGVVFPPLGVHTVHVIREGKKCRFLEKERCADYQRNKGVHNIREGKLYSSTLYRLIQIKDRCTDVRKDQLVEQRCMEK